MDIYNAFIMVIPFFAGYMLDLLVGDPLWLPNPTRLINSLIEYLENIVRGAFPRNPHGERNGGGVLALLVTVISLLTAAILLVFAWFFNYYLWFAFDLLMTYYALSVKKIFSDSAQLCEVLENEAEHGDLSRARLALSRITSSTTGTLNRQEIVRTGIAAVAEGTTRGAVAPMLFLAVGGGSFGIFYKAVDMLRVRLVHDNAKYRDIGLAAERLAEFCDYVPARLARLFMRVSARLLRLEYSARPAELDDIYRARRVMVMSSFLCAASLGAARFLFFCFILG